MKIGIHRNNILHLIPLLIPSYLFAQQIKPPVAETDYASTFIANPVSVNVLANDHSYEGDTLVIYAITNVSYGQATFEDSLIHYTPWTNSSTQQQVTINYIIKDLTTGLWSEPGDVIIQLERPKNKIFTPNKLGVRINALGNQFLAVDSFNYVGPSHHFEAPVNSGRHTIFNSSLWVAGLDSSGEIHTACERLRKGKLPFASHRGWDYWVGPVMDSIHYTPDYLTEYNRLWYLTREEVGYHANHYEDPAYLMSKRIKNWPANGFPELGTAAVLAPFADRNQNGYYDPENGDYPLIHGDEAIYFIFNDDYGEHTESFGRKLGIEVHGLAYGFDCEQDSSFNNTIFIRYQAINRSDTAYHDVYLGNFTNFVIGSYDDFLGCDTALNTYYAYNRDDFDDTVSAFYPGYMEHPPAQAVVWLNQPVDHFMYSLYPWPVYDTLFNLDPTTPARYYNYMKSVWNDSTHLTYGGDGHLGAVPVNHALTGDPLTGTGWIQENSGIEDQVLKAIGSHGPLLFNPGDTLTLELAYVFARDNEGNHLTSLELLKERVERVRWFYENDSTPCDTPWTGEAEYQQPVRRLKIVPNPARDFIRVSGFSDSETVAYQIISIAGIVQKKGVLKSGELLDIRKLVPGLYLIKFHTLEGSKFGRFIKL